MLLDDADDYDFDAGSITSEMVDNAIDVNISSMMCSNVSTVATCNHHQDFSDALQMRAEMASVKATHGLDPNTDINTNGRIFDDGYEGTLEGLVSMVDTFVPTAKLKDFEAKCAAIARDMKGLSAELLSKL